MVEYILPDGSDVDNPIEDAAFMEPIGAMKICGFTKWFELKNAATETRFTFTWLEVTEGSGVSYSLCELRREENIF